MFIRTPYNYDVNEASVASGLSCPVEENMTQQQFKDECDINEIVRRFGLGHKMPESVRIPQYGDFTQIDDYHSACNAIAEAGEAFDALPSDLRKRFQNDPGQFVDFCLNEGNRDELVKLGLVVPKAPPEVAAVATVEAAVAAVSSPAGGASATPPVGG